MISLIERLTGKRWNFGEPASAAALGGVEGALSFDWLDVGLYTIINDGVGDVDVVLWGQTYTVASNSHWDFMAHPDIRSVSPLAAPIAIPTYVGAPIEPPPVDPPPESQPPA